MNKNTTLPLTLFLAIALVVLNGCSKQEDKQAPQESATPGSAVESGETKPETQISDSDSVNAGQQTANNSDTTSQDTSGSKTKTDVHQPAKEQSSNNSGHADQLALAQKSGCLACHAIDKKVVGPPWRDVSKRYLNDPKAKEKLVAKVSKGGRGNWTDVVGTAAMPPYSPRVSDENIAKLVDFVLSLEK